MPIEAGTKNSRDFSRFEFETVSTASVSAAGRAVLARLFDAAYREANQAFLEKLYSALRYLSIVRHEGEVIGFGFADSLAVDLPRLPGQTIVLGGLCCIAPEYRRQGLFGELQRRSVLAGDAPQGGRFLLCGRMAHPAAFRVMSSNPTVVPKPGVAPTEWQRDVGRFVADVYGVDTFDAETFVCVGSGTTIGYPVVDLEVEDREWQVFENVDRSRGDSLLGIAWSPDAPPGW